MYCSTAEAIDIPTIAAMHIKPSRDAIKKVVHRTPIYEFYRDKVSFFVRCEKEGVIVCRDETETVGFVIVTKSMRRLNRLSITKGYLVKSMVKAAFGRYGLHKEMLRKLIRILLSFFSLSKVKPRSGRGREQSVRVDAKVLAIIVLEGRRRQGIGTKLLNHACEYLSEQGITEVAITTIVESDSAKRFYSNLGFVEKGICQESLGKSVYMTKRL